MPKTLTLQTREKQQQKKKSKMDINVFEIVAYWPGRQSYGFL